jgi:hypothetical protein
VVAPDGNALEVGVALEVAGRQVGVVTSAAGGVGLAYVRRDVEIPSAATAGGQAVRLEALPLAIPG